MSWLDDLEAIKKLDIGNMSQLLCTFPAQLEHAVRIGQTLTLSVSNQTIQDITVTGLGGSAIGSDLMRSYLSDELAIPFFTNRDYLLPNFVNETSLCIASSYSGDTEETLSAYDDAKARRARIVCITSGGLLKEKAERDGFPVIKIPSGFPPRAAVGFSSMSILYCLQALGLISDKAREVKETIRVLLTLRDAYQVESPLERNPAKQLALKLHDSIPLIYTASRRFDAVALRWKGQLAENAKRLAFFNVLPELNHNEIVGWESRNPLLNSIAVVLLRDKDDHERVRIRMDITREIVEPKAKDTVEVWSQGDSLLARIFSLIYLGDYLSFYLAMLNRVDPTPVKMIDFLKRRLRES